MPPFEKKRIPEAPFGFPFSSLGTDTLRVWVRKTEPTTLRRTFQFVVDHKKGFDKIQFASATS